MGAHTVDRDTDDTNKPLLNKENEAASCSQEDRCGDVEYDNEVLQQRSFPPYYLCTERQQRGQTNASKQLGFTSDC